MRRVSTAGRTATLLVALAAVAVTACARAPQARLDFVLKDMNGQDVPLADFKGRPILLNFWATWCAPCKAEIPILMELAAKYKDQNLAVIGVSVDDPPEDIQKFAAERQVNYPMLVGSGQDDLIAAFEAGLVVPVSWFIYPDGAILTKAQGIHSKEWFETQVQALLVD